METNHIIYALICLCVAVCFVAGLTFIGSSAAQTEAYNKGYSAAFSVTSESFVKGNDFCKAGWQVQSVNAGNITLCKVGTKCCKIIDKNYNEVGSNGC